MVSSNNSQLMFAERKTSLGFRQAPDICARAQTLVARGRAARCAESCIEYERFKLLFRNQQSADLHRNTPMSGSIAMLRQPGHCCLRGNSMSRRWFSRRLFA